MRLFAALLVCALLGAVSFAHAKSRKKINRKKVTSDDGSEEEDEGGDDPFKCYSCIGASCTNETRNEVEECFMCFSITKSDNSTVLGCVSDEDEAKRLEEDECAQGTRTKDGRRHTGRVCYCKEDGCNGGGSHATSFVLFVFVAALLTYSLPF